MIADIRNEGDSSDLNEKYTDHEAPTNTDNGARARSSNDNHQQTFLGQDKFHWRRSVPFQVIARQLQHHSITRIRICVGPVSDSTSRLKRGSALSSNCILFNELMLKNIQKCTTVEAHCAIGNNRWTVTLDELDKFVELIVARDVIGERSFSIKSMWDKFWGCPLFNVTMPRWRFLEILKYLRFDLNTERMRILREDRFRLASLL